ncbi:MAG: hypothetical protein ACFCGT_11385 [Sandaracinaceae bacterium]
MTRAALALLLSVAAAGTVHAWSPTPAAAQGEMAGGGRRPGLGGRYTNRHVTTGRNSLYLLDGPWAPPLLGIRRNGYGYDAGFMLANPNRDAVAGLYVAQRGLKDRFIFNIFSGVAFGLYDQFEAGATFLTFEVLPDFNFGGFPVFLTYFWQIGDHVDLGARLVWTSFHDDVCLEPTDDSPPTCLDPTSDSQPNRSRSQTTLNLGVPIVVRLGITRLDAAVLFPFHFRNLPLNIKFQGNTAVGISVPVRYAVNPIPELTLGIETGFYDENLGRANDLSVPLGAYVGWTVLNGGQLFDIGATFQWDHLFRPDPPAGIDGVQPGFWRVTFGFTSKRVVL